MQTLSDRSVALIEQLCTAYFTRQDYTEVISYFSEDITLVAPIFDQPIHGLQQLKEILPERITYFQPSLTPLSIQCSTEELTPEIISVEGLLTIVQQSDSSQKKFYLALTALCRVQPGKDLFISKFHLSVSGSAAREHDFQLRLQLQRQTTELSHRSRELQALLQNLPGGMICCLYDDDLTITQYSDGFLELMGITAEEISSLYQNSFRKMINPEDYEKTLQTVHKQLETGSQKTIEYRVNRKDGSVIWLLDHGQLITDSNGSQWFYCILINITEQRKAEDQLRYSLKRHELILNQTDDIIFEWDINRNSIQLSPNWEKKFGMPPHLEDITDWVVGTGRIHPDDAETFLGLADAMRRGEPYTENEIRFHTSDGRYIWYRIRATLQCDEQGKPSSAVGVLIDIDSEKKALLGLMDKAERDALTGLYNKTTTQTMIERFLQNSSQQSISALLFLDIDNFKLVNDNRGHLLGDAVLSDISLGLKRLFRSSDIIGRVGGDEFLVFLKDIPSAEFAEHKAMQICEFFHGLLKEEDFSISTSVGISLFPLHGKTFQILYQKADYALYQAKRTEKNTFRVFQPEFAESLLLPENSNPATAIESDIGGKNIRDWLTKYLFETLYQSEDIDATVNLMLKIIGDHLDVSRVYIFEDFNAQYCSNTFEWCNTGIQPEIQNLGYLSYQEIPGYRDNFLKQDIFYCRDIRTLPNEQRVILERQNIKSMLHCAIREHGVFRGFVGFDDCDHYRYWTQDQIGILTLISQILSIFLMKHRTQQRLEGTLKQWDIILENQDTWLYIVDPNDYALLYLNAKTKSLAPEAQIGTTCHRVFYHRDTPCENCILRAFEKQGTRSCEMYNPILNVWFVTSVAPICWNNRSSYLITCQDITKYKKQEKSSSK